MPLQPVPVPAHYSADIGYRVLRPLRPYLEAARPQLAAGITASRAKQLLGGLKRIAEGIEQALVGGELDGDGTWRALAADTLAELQTFEAAVGPIMVRLSSQAGQLVAQRAQEVAAGADLPLLTSDEALAQIVLSDADVGAILSALDGMMGG